MSESKVIVALLAGLAAGATLGILYAPEAGTATRGRFSGSVDRLAMSIREMASGPIGLLLDMMNGPRDYGYLYQEDTEHA